MKFIADVNIPQSIINELIKRKHNVLDCKKSLLDASDIKLIEVARKEKRIILTKDKDFIALTRYPKYKVSTIVIRLQNQSSKNILDILLDLIENQNEKLLNSSLTIIKDNAARSYSYK
jgi:predicted nuclease of predicted toxin-antitoxin system